MVRRPLARLILCGGVVLLGAVAASAIGYGLSEYLLNLDYHWNFWLWIHGLIGGAIIIGLFGFLTSKGDIRASTWTAIQRAE